MKVRFTPEALLAVREKRAWWQRHREKVPALFVQELATRASICAGVAKSFDDQLAGADPACRLTVDERARNDAFLAAYYGRRTVPRRTGDAVVDKNLAELAAARDALCACANEDCVRTAEKTVMAAVKPVPPELTSAGADAVAISDEVSRCADRIQMEVARSQR